MAETENTVKRIMPHDSDAERSVIASMLMDADAISDVSGMLVKEDFYNGQFGILFEGICSLHSEGKAVDEVILAERLRSMGAPETLYSMSFLRISWLPVIIRSLPLIMQGSFGTSRFSDK